MIIKGLVEEDFVNYKKPSMFVIFPKCSLKCDKENGTHDCYNASVRQEPDIKINSLQICNKYLINPITHALVCGGLEPFDTPEQLLELVQEFRKHTNDDIVIYTGYTEEEINTGMFSACNIDINLKFVNGIRAYPNIVIKYGRFRPNQESHLDEVLGVQLASDNQYAVAYNMEA